MAVRVMDECIGRLLVRDDGHGICEIRMLREGEDVADEMDSPLLNCAQAQLRAYFSGERQTFDLSVSVSGTPFEQAVWQRLCAIPYGETRTYAQIGAACGKNPVLIVVPCHRVVGSGGRLTGFAAGLDAKQRLLALEGHTVRNGRMV